MIALKSYDEFANGTVISYNDGPSKTRHHLDFQKKTTVTVLGTGKAYPFYNESNPDQLEPVLVDWDGFMGYFSMWENRRAFGIVIDIENYSTLTAYGVQTGRTWHPQPAKPYKVAIAVQETVDLTITITHANVLTIRLHDGQTPVLWMATDYGLNRVYVGDVLTTGLHDSEGGPGE